MRRKINLAVICGGKSAELKFRCDRLFTEAGLLSCLRTGNLLHIGTKKNHNINLAIAINI